MTQLIDNDELATVKLPMTYDEFIHWCTSEHHYEWVEGFPQRISPVNLSHQRIVMFLSELIQRHLKATRQGELLLGPFQMRLSTVDRGREPDLLVVLQANAVRIRENYVDGPADLAIEVISPGGARRDRVEKFAEYEQEGVREYWIIDPAKRTADFFALAQSSSNNQPKYQSIKPGVDGFYDCNVLPGLRVKPNWLWLSPLPEIDDIAAEL